MLRNGAIPGKFDEGGEEGECEGEFERDAPSEANVERGEEGEVVEEEVGDGGVEVKPKLLSRGEGRGEEDEERPGEERELAYHGVFVKEGANDREREAEREEEKKGIVEGLTIRDGREECASKAWIGREDCAEHVGEEEECREPHGTPNGNAGKRREQNGRLRPENQRGEDLAGARDGALEKASHDEGDGEKSGKRVEG